jgi:putative ABC transport system permease protein
VSAGLGRVVRSGVTRRRLPTVAVAVSVFIAVTTCVLAGSLLVASSAPFDHAFADQRGAHLTAEFDVAKVTTAALSASAHADGVTAAAGPFPTVTIDGTSGSGPFSGGRVPPLTVVGRADPGGPVDALTLTTGRWATGPGDIVVSSDYPGPLTRPGAILQVTGGPVLTVVGVARSVSQTADAWVTPAQAAALSPTGYQMLYRFADAGSAASMAAHQTAVAAAVPAGALLGARSWLDTRQAADGNTGTFVPLLVAFGALGLVMSGLIVGNVVAGTVGAATRRIGILKALGCTPGQVVRAYTAQALVPATAGAALGLVAGNLLAVPLLSAADQVYGGTTAGVAPWLSTAGVAGALALVTLAACGTAWRAGRLRAVDTIAVGRAPGSGRRRWAAGLAARMPVPRPVGLGLAQPPARPVRAAALLAAVAFGAATVTLATGLATTLTRVAEAKSHDHADVEINTRMAPARAGTPDPSGPPPSGVDTGAVEAAIRGQSGTSRYYTLVTSHVTVPGFSGTTDVYGFGGDATWAGYQLVSGRWFQQPGEAVAVATFLSATGARVGDTVVLTDHGTPVRVRIVGEVFDPHKQLMEVLTDAATLRAAEPGLQPDQFFIQVRAGTDVAGYLRELNATLEPLHVTAAVGGGHGTGSTLVALGTLAGLLTLMLVTVAGLGVLNTVLLEVRDRVHDLGIYKALGLTPGQTVTMVLASVVPVGILGGLLGVPAGRAAHAWVVAERGHRTGLRLPASTAHVFDTRQLLLLGAGGLAIAVLGALLPAGWAARARTATVLRTE